MRKIFHNHFLMIFLLFLTAIAVGFPLFNLQMLDGHDAPFHLFKALAIKEGILDEQFIALVNPQMLGGLGYGANLFYGALSSYGIALLSLFTHNLGFAANLFTFLTIFASGLTMYYFLYQVLKKKIPALVGAFVYIIFPYHLYDIYTRMSIAEVTSFVFMPLVFAGIYDIIWENQKRWYLLTLGTSFLILTHTISTFLCALFALLFLLFFLKKCLTKKKILILLGSLGLALVIALPTITSLLICKYSKADYLVFDHNFMNTNPKFMASHSLNLFKITNKPGIIAILSLVLLIIILPFFLYKKEKNSPFLLPSYLLTILATILTLNIIPWQILPNIFALVQYPFRFFFITNFFLAFTISLIYLKFNPLSKKIFLILIIPLLIVGAGISLNLTGNRKTLSNDYTDDNGIFLKGDWVKSRGTASSEYLPRKAIFEYEYFLNRKKIEIIKGSGEYSNFSSQGSHLEFTMQIEKESRIELPYIYYPGYKIKANDEKVEPTVSPHGLVEISLAPGEYIIESNYESPLIISISSLISLITLINLLNYIKKRINLL